MCVPRIVALIVVSIIFVRLLYLSSIITTNGFHFLFLCNGPIVPMTTNSEEPADGKSYSCSNAWACYPSSDTDRYSWQCYRHLWLVLIAISIVVRSHKSLVLQAVRLIWNELSGKAMVLLLILANVSVLTHRKRLLYKKHVLVKA